ncbi:hypothetical protein [Streptomyces sp. NBC_00358]|uniref:LexA family protein n=1 Tax=Streptomyces sp. NBC_00358 TaxID=2975725 RepID=UPI002E26AF4E
MVAPVLVAAREGPGSAGGVAQSGPGLECAVNRRPAHLTEREEQILHIIRRSLEDRGEGPTVTEIGVAAGLRSKSTVAYHLRPRTAGSRWTISRSMPISAACSMALVL